MMGALSSEGHAVARAAFPRRSGGLENERTLCDGYLVELIFGNPRKP
jgi:hypothetical protein